MGDPGLTFALHVRRSADALCCAIAGRAAIDTAAALLADAQAALDDGAPPCIAVDLTDVTYFDSAGAAVLLEIRRWCVGHGRAFDLRGASPKIAGLMRLLDVNALSQPERIAHPGIPNIFAVIGAAAVKFVMDARELIVFTGALAIAAAGALARPGRIRWRETLLCLERVGVQAVPIVLLIHFLLGVTVSFLGGSQLRMFGANIYIADLVGIGMAQELAPMMTAILLAGRSGAAFAAEIGTMKVSEEVDALVAMGFSPQRFLVIPKLIATMIAMPCLTILAECFGILGGALISVSFFDLTVTGYVNETYRALNLAMIMEGLVKAEVFALLVASIGCMRGFQVRGGAESVGVSTTSAVVSGIFLIIVANAVFTIMFQYL